MFRTFKGIERVLVSNGCSQFPSARIVKTVNVNVDRGIHEQRVIVLLLAAYRNSYRIIVIRQLLEN